MAADNRDEILRYLETHGTVDKDSASRLEPRAKKQFSKSRQKNRLTLDLHGLIEDAAVKKLRMCIQTCKETGVNDLIVIHGRGLHSPEGPVLKKAILCMLENELRGLVKGFRPANPREGGEGATVVHIF